MLPSTTIKKSHLMIHGRVQGVFFRNSMQREAQYLAITGWVRNRADGTVEAEVHGAPAAIDALLRWAQRGPELANVERVEVSPGEGDFSGFEIR